MSARQPRHCNAVLSVLFRCQHFHKKTAARPDLAPADVAYSNFFFCAAITAEKPKCMLLAWLRLLKRNKSPKSLTRYINRAHVVISRSGRGRQPLAGSLTVGTFPLHVLAHVGAVGVGVSVAPLSTATRAAISAIVYSL